MNSYWDAVYYDVPLCTTAPQAATSGPLGPRAGVGRLVGVLPRTLYVLSFMDMYHYSLHTYKELLAVISIPLLNHHPLMNTDRRYHTQERVTNTH